MERPSETLCLEIEENTIMNASADMLGPGGDATARLPEGANIFSRKVARSGHISFEGRPYFISKALAGRYIDLVVLADRLIVDAAIPLHKEYPLI
jgi:hypothetical protein